MEAADIIGVIIGASTIGLLLLVIFLFQSVYIVLTRKELAEKYDAELFHSHDPESYPDYLMAPAFYS